MIDTFKSKLIIHRGKLNKKTIENTLSGFLKCIEKEYIIELDVRLLKDNTIVVFHDPTLNKLAGVNSIVENYNYEDLRKIKVKGKYQIPTLQSILNLVKGKVPILIDIKGNINNYKLEGELLRLLKNYSGDIYIQSFQVRSLNYMWKKAKRYKYGLIVLNDIHLKIFTKLWIKFCSSFISCHICCIKSKYMQKIRKNKLLIGWTITNKKDIDKYRDYCDNLICENIE